MVQVIAERQAGVTSAKRGLVGLVQEPETPVDNKLSSSLAPLVQVAT